MNFKGSGCEYTAVIRAHASDAEHTTYFVLPEVVLWVLLGILQHDAVTGHLLYINTEQCSDTMFALRSQTQGSLQIAAGSHNTQPKQTMREFVSPACWHHIPHMYLGDDRRSSNTGDACVALHHCLRAHRTSANVMFSLVTGPGTQVLRYALLCTACQQHFASARNRWFGEDKMLMDAAQKGSEQ